MNDAEVEAPILWPLDSKSQLIGKDPECRERLQAEEKGMTENEMVGWHHQFNNPTQPYPATLSGHSHSIGHPWAAESLQMVTAAMKLRDAYSLEEKL